MAEFSGIGCGNKTPGNLRSRGLGIRLADPPRVAIALNFVQLIAINGNVAASLHITGPA
jgi:hypothetical protein